MTTSSFGLVALLIAMGSPEGAAAQARRGGALPRELTAGLELDHLHRDMLTVTTSRYEVELRLRIARNGRAELSLVGDAAYRRGEVPTTGPARPGTDWEDAIDHAWSGDARRDGRDIVIRFTRSTAYAPALATDVVWRCTPVSIAAPRARVRAWQCATSQPRTQASGPGHALPTYMQVPLVLARRPVRLHARVTARGGADHRSVTTSAAYSRSR